jgi:hypothetical protein
MPLLYDDILITVRIIIYYGTLFVHSSFFRILIFVRELYISIEDFIDLMSLFAAEISGCGFHGYAGVVVLVAATLLFLYAMLSLKDLIHIKKAIFSCFAQNFQDQTDNC